MTEGQNRILTMVLAANAAKKLHGPNSAEFKEMQQAAFEEIDRQYDGNPETGLVEDLIPTGEKDDMAGAEISILVQKKGKAPKGKGVMMCSYRMYRTPMPADTEELRKAVRGHQEKRAKTDI
jgi:hypothetical protein